MKSIYLLAILILVSFSVNAQLNPCRPKICLIDYCYHNDNFPNADMTAIKAALPDILIDNTPGGYWGGGCLPSEYTPLGIQVFSYITGGYEGTEYGTSEDDLTANIARVNAIAADGATGVFLDEVSSFPNTASIAYITSIYNECQAKGLKLILNAGVSTFDSWLMSHCDYLMSDEQYDGTRSPTTSESLYADRLLVVAYDITNASIAATISQGAQSNGFGYSYACVAYTSLPSWLGNYMTLITQSPPTTPIITLNGNILYSDAANGNQWYDQTQGIIAGETGQTYTPTANGDYYVIVTISGCSSDTSNIINVVLSGMTLSENNNTIKVYPNPANDMIFLNTNNTNNAELTLNIYNLIGKLIRTELMIQNQQQINIGDLSNGIYMIEINNMEWTEKQKIIIQR